ncbi:MAG: DUF4384 domain-containing protein [Planctomycetota bacterium]|nr:DUF4384 domain-containing protein [Planctomycetota bacterium]
MNRLSFSLLAFAFLAPDASRAATGDGLDQRVASTFKVRCAVCHDGKPGDAAGDVDFLLDFVRLATPDHGYFDADNAKDSYLREVISSGSMPKKRWKDIAWNGQLTNAEKQDILKWIDRGGPSPIYRQQAAADAKANVRADIPERVIVEHIARDLGQLKGAELQNARYLTLTNLHNMVAVSADELELYRQAVVKLLNSLSRSSDVLGTDVSEAVKRMVAVDRERTILRFDLRDIGWTAGDWERVVQHYPYALLHLDWIGKSVYGLTSSKFPYMRADWFVFATSQPPLYHDLVGIPKTLGELEKRLGVQRLRNIRNRKVHRAGFSISKVSVNNRLLERHEFPGGYYILSYDFGSNDGQANFFQNPFGPLGAFETDKAFRHDGGELIYRLPNGFQAYALVKANGERLSIAPSAIVHDDSLPGGAIINGISCVSCHYDGMKPENPARAAKLDEVRRLALDNGRRFGLAERNLLEELYPTQADYGRLMESDRRSFRAAMAAAGITKTGAAEPVRALFDRFARNLDMETAAAGFGVSVKRFSQLLERESETRQLRARLEIGGIQRQLYVVEFHTAARLTGLGEPRAFKELPLPYFGKDPESPAVAVINPQVDVPPTVALLDADNLAGTLKVTVSSGDDRQHFTEGQVIPCVIKSTKDCFITVLGVDPTGNIAVLMPNKWHPELRLKAGRSLHIPTTDMGFEFFAEPPHGTTEIRVIATARPLRIKGMDAKSLAASDGFVSLGNRKGIGVRQRTKPAAQPDRSQPPTGPQAAHEVDLRKQFAPNEWGTARWKFTTHPPR